MHPITPLLMWGPFAGWLIWRSFAVYQLPVLPVLAIGVAGIVTWTLTEYWLHRFLFHYPANGFFYMRFYSCYSSLHKNTNS